MPHLFYTHAAEGWVMGKHFTQHVLDVTDDEARELLGPFWRLATDAEIEAAKPVEAATKAVKKAATRKATS